LPGLEQHAQFWLGRVNGNAREWHRDEFIEAADSGNVRKLAGLILTLIDAQLGSNALDELRKLGPRFAKIAAPGYDRRIIDRDTLIREWNRVRPTCRSDSHCANQLASLYETLKWTSEAILKNVRACRRLQHLPPAPTSRKKKPLRK
jgi:hypothetical protein